jgi:protein TonB
MAAGATFTRRAAALRQWRPDRFQRMLIISVVLHALLLTLRFVDPERFERVFEHLPLEVVLVNARSEEAPAKAQLLAQHNLAGGGEAELGRAQSPLPSSAMDLLGQDPDEAQISIREMQDVQQQLLAHLKQELAKLPPPDPKKALLSPDERQREEKRRYMLKQLAVIEKRIQEENARPRKRFISPATQQVEYARYYDTMRLLIEERGTRDFPESQGRKLYGELTLRFTVDARGQLVETEVVVPAKSKTLNRQAVAILQAAGPFGPFSDAMRKQADQVVITSQFRFSRTEGFETELRNSN